MNIDTYTQISSGKQGHALVNCVNEQFFTHAINAIKRSLCAIFKGLIIKTIYLLYILTNNVGTIE